MTARLYERQEIDERVDGNLSLATLFKTAQGKLYESNRPMTTRCPVTQGMGSWIRQNQAILEEGVMQNEGTPRQYPLLGGLAALTTLNGIVYFLVPRESTVLFEERGVQAQLSSGHQLLPYFADERDTLIARLNKARRSGESLRGIMALLDESVWQLGEHNVPSAIIRYGLLPEVAYLGSSAARDRVDEIDSGRFNRQHESGRLLAQAQVRVRVEEPEVASL